MKETTLKISDITPPFNFDLTAKYYCFYPWSYSNNICTRVEKLSSGKITKWFIWSQGSIDNPKLLVKIKSLYPLTATDKKEIINKIYWCFGLKENLTDFYRICETDPFLKKAKENLYGLRIRAFPTILEALIESISAQNIPLSRVYLIMKLICEKLGERIKFDGEVDYTFPDIKRMKEASITEFYQCKVGYRANYILELVKTILKNKIDLESLKNLPTEKAREILMSFKGVGEYTSNLTLIIGLRRKDILHLDLWTREIISTFYFKRKLSDQKILKFAKEKWKGYTSLALMYLLTDVDNLSWEFGIQLRLKSAATT